MSETVGRITFGPLQTPADAIDARIRQAKIMSSMMPKTFDYMAACGCVGPQPGEIKCPCVLRAEMQMGNQMIQVGIVINGIEYDLVPKQKKCAA